MEYRDLPSAWKEAPRAMHAGHAEADGDDPQGGYAHGEHGVGGVKNIFSRGTGMTQKGTVPKTMMEAYSAPRLMVPTMRLRFRHRSS